MAPYDTRLSIMIMRAVAASDRFFFFYTKLKVIKMFPLFTIEKNSWKLGKQSSLIKNCKSI